MGFKFWNWILSRGDQPKGGTVDVSGVSCQELYEAGQEFQIRQLCLAVCINMIANAVGRCEVRTFRRSEEIRELEYYTWNVEPNTNQNSTAFWHKLVTKLIEDNEALVISTKRPDGSEAVVVADDWTEPEQYPSKENEYKNVRVGEFTYTRKTFMEHEVLHLKLNHLDMQPVLQGLYQSYARLVSAAVAHHEWDQGQHWKVHVNQMALGGQTANGEEWTTSFQRMIEAQVKPFLSSGGAILPEFDGYTYSKVSGDGSGDTRDIRAMIDDIFTMTARAMQIPAVLIDGQVSGAENAIERFLSGCIDPICDQLQEEIIRKRYGYQLWAAGNYVQVDTSAIRHFDIFGNAPNVEKLVGSGAFTINDVLRAAGLPIIKEPWADKHFLTKNIADIQEAAISLEA